MDTSELRKRILRALDEGRKDAAARRGVVDEAAKAYELFLSATAVPLLKQAATVLNAENQPVAVHTPAGSARLSLEKSPQTFIEVELDSAGHRPVVVGRVSLDRGHRGVTVEEKPLGDGKPVASLTEEDLSTFLVAQIPRLLARS